MSRPHGAFGQFARYVVIGAFSTVVQASAFYILAAFCLKCLSSSDWAVKTLSLPAAVLSDSARAIRFAIDNTLAFLISNVVCWILNRIYVFTPGRHGVIVEFLAFVAASATAMGLATAISSILIGTMGIATTFAFLIQVLVALSFNFVVRKFVVFKG